MKKLIIFIPLILVVIIIFFFIFNLLWKGVYQKGAGKTISLNLIDNKIMISSEFGKYNSSQKVSFINSIVDLNKKEIYIYIYTKYYNWNNSIFKNKNIILLSEKGKYKIYYKNIDGSLNFIKEIEYK